MAGFTRPVYTGVTSAPGRSGCYRGHRAKKKKERSREMTAKSTPENEEWETVAEARTKMIFDTDGDQYTGTWEGFENITDPNTGEVYIYANFRDPDGTPKTTSASYQLERGLKNVEVGRKVRLTRVGQTDLGKGKNPMTDFKIEVAR